MDGTSLPLSLAALGVRMSSSGADPLIVILLFLLRCLVPLLLMLGLSYLLRRLGLIAEQEPPSPAAPADAGPAAEARKGAHPDGPG